MSKNIYDSAVKARKNQKSLMNKDSSEAALKPMTTKANFIPEV